MLIESVSKDELIKFIGQVRVEDLIKHIPLPVRENMSKIKDEIAGARKAVKEFFIKHHMLIEQTPLAEIEEPLLELLSDAHQFLDLENSDLTLGELSESALGAARKNARRGRPRSRRRCSS